MAYIRAQYNEDAFMSFDLVTAPITGNPDYFGNASNSIPDLRLMNL